MSKFSAGRYRGRMKSASLGVSNAKETPQISFLFEPIFRYGPNEEELVSGDEEQTIFKYITDNTVDHLIQDLQALGYNRESFAEIDSSHENAYPWEGIEFDCVMKVQDYKGNPQERWEFARGQSGKPIQDVKVRELDAKYGKYLQGFSGAKAPTSAAPVGAGANGSQEDIPF